MLSLPLGWLPSFGLASSELLFCHPVQAERIPLERPDSLSLMALTSLRSGTKVARISRLAKSLDFRFDGGFEFAQGEPPLILFNIFPIYFIFPKILFFSDNFRSNARIIFFFVSRRQLLPFSMRSMVRTDTPAFLASSALLIKICSRYLFREFIFSPSKLRVIWDSGNQKADLFIRTWGLFRSLSCRIKS